MTSIEQIVEEKTETVVQSNESENKVFEEIGNPTIKILKLIIDEIHPDEETYTKGPVIDGEDLSEKIHVFFGKHVENIFSSTGTRPARFIDPNSSILNSFKNILNISNDEISEDNKTRITNTLSNQEEIWIYVKIPDTKRLSFFLHNNHSWSVPHPKQIVKVKRAFDNLLGTWRNKPMDVVPKKCGGGITVTPGVTLLRDTFVRTHRA